MAYVPSHGAPDSSPVRTNLTNNNKMPPPAPASDPGPSAAGRSLTQLAAVAAGCGVFLGAPADWGARWLPFGGGHFLGRPYSWQRWLLCAAVALVLAGGRPWARLVRETLWRDLTFLFRISRLAFNMLLLKLRGGNVVDQFERTVETFPDKTMIVFVNQDSTHDEMTFRQAGSTVNRLSRYFRRQGLRKGDVAAVCLENRLIYPCVWLSLAKLGVISALVNTNVTGEALIHTLGVVKAKVVVFSKETENAFADIISSVPESVAFHKLVDDDGAGAGAPSHRPLAERTKCLSASASASAGSDAGAADASDADAEKVQLTLNDPLLYVFTSGTTGLPKAANIKHIRYLMMAHALPCIASLNPQTNVAYTALPMYHSSANGLVIGPVLVKGMSVVCRKKFSASNFWKDCTKHKVTVAQYIGEAARYLYQTAPNEYETKHQVHTLFGNGLRPEIWEAVRERFGVDIVEFYAATEGNCSMVNHWGRTGAVGFVSRLLPPLVPYRLVRVHPDTGEVERDPLNGDLCVVCRPGESGELVAPIHRGNPIRDFDGYVDKTSTDKKVLRNVFAKGDLCFRTGDLMEMDELGYLYFLDRCGDTFRWKGENVSTLEVEATLSKILGYKDVVVYGVQIPGTEGRACMAAVAKSANVQRDWPAFYAATEKRLPFYARPVFIRIVEQLEVTATYKLKKVALQKSGFDTTKTDDAIWFLDRDNRTYSRLTDLEEESIVSGRRQF